MTSVSPCKEDDFNAFKANNFVGTYTHIEGTLCQQGKSINPEP